VDFVSAAFSFPARFDTARTILLGSKAAVREVGPTKALIWLIDRNPPRGATFQHVQISTINARKAAQAIFASSRSAEPCGSGTAIAERGPTLRHDASASRNAPIANLDAARASDDAEHLIVWLRAEAAGHAIASRGSAASLLPVTVGGSLRVWVRAFNRHGTSKSVKPRSVPGEPRLSL
jgi:hypothetical protein